MVEDNKMTDISELTCHCTAGITINDFALLKVIGVGSYGKVMLVRKNDTGELLAMKVLRKEHLVKRNQVEHTKTERRVLEIVNHPFVVKLRYAFQNTKKLYFLLEYCPGGELFFHLQKAGRFDEERTKFYASQIVLAMKELHKFDVVYRE
jgi:serine/threonine protein kinase